ncbi:IS66 family insertion sequence element accessory protein TnpB [Paraburkholderia susongensis]|uniref:IS66 family insertion sequence element accessory protein TnpB n=1 Tax=Paraburkholderia susongensis TaxID=1515439 RepID=UPI000A1CBEAC
MPSHKNGYVTCYITVLRARLRIRGKRSDLLKVLWWRGDGMCLLMKQLEKGRFVWPQADGGVICLSPAQLSMLLEGIDWRQPTRTARPTSAL